MSQTTHAKAGAVTGSLDIAEIRRRLSNEIVGHHMYVFGTLASTATALRRCADAGAREGTVVLAEEQQQGCGRLGQPWYSPPGVNLYASVLFRPDLSSNAVPAFSHIAGLALTDALWVEGAPAALREPNDVLIDGRKVGCTLVEWSPIEGRIEYVVLGVCANVNVTRDELRAGLGQAADTATSLCEEVGREIDRNAFAAAVLGFLEKWLGAYTARGPAAVIAAWRSRLVTGALGRARGPGGKGCAAQSGTSPSSRATGGWSPRPTC